MKNIYIITALLFFTVISSYSQWQTFQLPVNIKFIDVCVAGLNNIWAAGDSGKVFKSIDNGSNWQDVSVGQFIYTINHISAIDENKAWVSFEGLPDAPIYFTSNGGINWSGQYINPRSFINNIHFFNANTGYLIADPVNDTLGFFVTRNGGNTWQRSVNSPIGFSSYVITDNMINQIDTGFIWFSTVYGFLRKFYKLNGGLNNQWQVFDFNNTVPVRTSVFKDYQIGLTTAGHSVYKTTNGGSNWFILQDSSIAGDIVQDFINVPGTDWVILNGLRRIRISYDFCNSWQPLTTLSTSMPVLSFSDCTDSNNIWISWNNGRLLKYNINYIGINLINANIPSAIQLYQNYPNPFNPVTKIKFALPLQSDFSVKVYDILGREVYRVADSKKAGEYEFTFDGTTFSSGIYFYQLQAGNFLVTKKMILLK